MKNQYRRQSEKVIRKRLIQDQKEMSKDLYNENRAENEPHVCSQFGCGRKLTIREALFGHTKEDLKDKRA